MLLTPSPGPNLPDVCTVRDTHGAFFSVALDAAKPLLYQSLVASAATQVELMGMHDSRSLIVVSKVKGTKHRVLKFPLDQGDSPRGGSKGVFLAEFDAYKDDCRMRVISKHDTLGILMVSYKHGVRWIGVIPGRDMT